MSDTNPGPQWAKRLWFVFSTLPARGRFLLGKASFVEADVAMTTNQITEAGREGAAPPEGRLLSHFRLKTRKPRTGAQGWGLFAERLADPGPHLAARLACGFCGHHFYLQVLAALDPLAIPPGPPPGLPALYGSDWFEFMPEGMPGVPWLSCPHCEQKGRPGVRFLSRQAS